MISAVSSVGVIRWMMEEMCLDGGLLLMVIGLIDLIVIVSVKSMVIVI